MEGLQLMLLPSTPALTSVKEQDLVFKSVHYNQRQCAIMDHVIDQLKVVIATCSILSTVLLSNNRTSF